MAGREQSSWCPVYLGIMVRQPGRSDNSSERGGQDQIQLYLFTVIAQDLQSDGVCPMSGPAEHAPIQVQHNTAFSESTKSIWGDGVCGGGKRWCTRGRGGNSITYSATDQVHWWKVNSQSDAQTTWPGWSNVSSMHLNPPGKAHIGSHAHWPPAPRAVPDYWKGTDMCWENTNLHCNKKPQNWIMAPDRKLTARDWWAMSCVSKDHACTGKTQLHCAVQAESAAHAA